MTIRPASILLALLAAALADRGAVADEPLLHPVVQELVTEGFPVPGGVRVPLTPPLLTGGMDAGQQEAAIRGVEGMVYDRFIEDRLTARQVLRVEPAQSYDGGMVRRLDQYFIVHGGAVLLRDEEAMEGFLAKEEAAAKAEDEGKAKGFQEYLESEPPGMKKPPAGQPYVYRYRYALIEKVVISGLLRGLRHSEPKLFIESAVSEADLLADADNPTQWQTIPRKAERDDQLGPAAPYPGLAGYLQVTELGFLPGAVLVECHGVLAEPTAWFRGRNLLGSKLSIAAQENVRSLRRKVKKLNAQQAEAAPN